MSSNYIDSCGHIWKLDKKFVKQVKQSGVCLLKNNLPKIYIYYFCSSLFAIKDNYYTLLDNYVLGKLCSVCSMIRKLETNK